MASINIDKVTDAGATTPANSEETSGLPTEILELPIFAGLLQGSPAALFTKTGDKSLEATTAVKHQRALADTGIFLFRDKASGLDLIYNGQFISKELLDTAAKKGKLTEVAQPLAETVAAFGGVAPAAGPAGASPMAPGPSGGLPESPINTQRLSNLEQGSATSGLAGQGRVLNSLVRPTI